MPDLKTIVQRMIDANESEEDIDAVVARFKELNPPKDPGPASSPVSPSEPDTFAGGVLKSLSSGEAFGAGAKGGLGWLKGAVLDLPETVIGAVKDFATSASDIPKMLRDAPGAIRHGIPAMGQQMKETFDQAGSDPDAFGRMMGQLTGQPLVTEGIIRGAPLARKPVGAAIEGTGRVMRRHQPVSGMMPRFGEMRTMRNVERGVGSGIEKLGQMIRPKPEPTPPNFTGSGTPSQFTPGSDYNIDLNQPIPSKMGGQPTGTGSRPRGLSSAFREFPDVNTQNSFDVPVPKSNTTGSGMPSQFTPGVPKTAPPAIPAAPSKMGGPPTGSGMPSKFNQGPARVPEAPLPPSPFGVTTGSGMPSKFTPGRPNTDAIIPPVPETFPGPMTRQQIVPENIDLNTGEIIEPLRAKKTKGNWRSTLSKLAKDDTGSAEMPEWVNSFFDEDLGTIPSERIDLNAEVSKLGRAESITPEEWGNWGDLDATKEALPDLINDASGSTVAAPPTLFHGTRANVDALNPQGGTGFGHYPKSNLFSENPEYTSLYSLGETAGHKRNIPPDATGANTIAANVNPSKSLDLTKPLSPADLELISAKITEKTGKPTTLTNESPDYVAQWVKELHDELPYDAVRFAEHGQSNWAVKPDVPMQTPWGVPLNRPEVPSGQLTNKRMFELSEQRALEGRPSPGRQFADSVSPNEFSEDMMFAPDELINPDIPEMMSPFENQFDPRIAPGGGDILEGARETFGRRQEPDIANDMSQRQGPRQTQMPPSRDVTPEAPVKPAGQPRLIKEDGTKVKPVGAKGEAFKVTDPNGKHLGDIEITEKQIAEIQAHPEYSDVPREEIIKSIYDEQYENIMEQHGVAENARTRVKVEPKDNRLKRTAITPLAGEPTFSTTKPAPKNPLDPDAAFAPDGDIIPIAREKRILDRDQSTDLRYKPLLPAEMRTALGEGETFKKRLENLIEASKPLDDPDLVKRSAERDAFIKAVVGEPELPPLRSKKTQFSGKAGKFANYF